MSANTPGPVLSGAPTAAHASALAGRAIIALAPRSEADFTAVNGNSRVVVAESLVHLLDLLRSEERSVVLLEGGVIAESDLELAARIPDLPTRPVVVALGLKDSMGAAITMARRLGLGCAFTADCLSYKSELAQFVHWLDIGGPRTGLASHLEEAAQIRGYRLIEKPDKGAVIDSVLDLLSQVNADRSFIFDLRLIMEEVLNNAIYHAFRDQRGNEKYSIGSFQEIGDGEEINVEAGYDSRTMGIAIADNQGKLSRDTILNKLGRHLSVQGLLDENGRGLYLTYSLGGRVIFNLHRGKLTELVVLFPTSPEAWPEKSPLKPILIFERS